MDWYKILLAITLIGMMVLIFPRMRAASQSAPKGDANDWKAFLIPIIAVGLFIALLTQMV